MADEDVERIAREEHAADTEHGAGIGIAADGVHRDGMLCGMEKMEEGRAVKQGNVDAAWVIAMRHHIAVGCRSKGRAPRQVGEATIILHLAEADERRYVVAAHRGNDFSHAAQFRMVAGVGPAPASVRKEFKVIRQAVVLTIKEILRIEEAYAQRDGGCLSRCRQWKPQTTHQHGHGSKDMGADTRGHSASSGGRKNCTSLSRG